MTGKMLGDYELLEVIGKGGQGEIYKAFDTKLKRMVAIKVFHAPTEIRRKKLAHFKYEARLASSINHPNICTVYALFEQDGHTCLVMELVEGKNLFELAFGHPLEIKSAIHLIIQVANALVVAHSQGIIHRDIKPRNIMVKNDGQVIILDFGLAKLIETSDEVFDFEAEKISPDSNANEIFFEGIAEDLFMTVDGLPFGTPSSSPPEMALGKATDVRSDVYSVGGVLYLLLTGKYAFMGKTVKEVRQKVLNEQPVPIESARQVGDEIPTELSKIVGRSLQKNPDDRFQTMAEMRDALVDVLKKLEGNEADEQPATFSNPKDFTESLYPPLSPKPFWQKPLFIWSGIVTLLIVILLVWYFF